MGETKNDLDGDLYLYAGTIDFSGTTTVSGSRVGFAEGASFSWNPVIEPIKDRGTFSHWKQTDVGNGELTIPQIYVDNGSIIDYLATGTVAGSSQPLIQAELRCYGTAGAVEHCYQFADISEPTYSMTEGKPTMWSMTAQLAKQPSMVTGTLIG